MESLEEFLELFQFLLFPLLFRIQLFRQLQKFFSIHIISPDMFLEKILHRSFEPLDPCLPAEKSGP
jgi:hypothetical protein